MLGVGSATGKFGELLQGKLPGENTHFLITLPITNISIAKFQYGDINTGSKITPHDKVKSALLAQKIMSYFKLSSDWNLSIYSQIPVGKGLGSSTADLVACSRAITHATRKHLPTQILLNLLKEIEPSDGIMYDGIVCFYHRLVALHSKLGYLPNIMIVGVDEGGILDTVKFNQELNAYTSKEQSAYAILLNEMVNGINSRNLKKVGDVSTKSAILHQQRNPKKNLESFIQICEAVGALGIIVAHSGSYIGIMMDQTHPEYIDQLASAEKKLKEKSLFAERFYPFSEKNIYQTDIADV